MTKLEYYKLLCRSAVDGTFPSLSMDRNSCRYRGKENKRCAVGVLMSDEDYDARYEYVGVAMLPMAVVTNLLPEGMSLTDLASTQKSHDSLAFRSYWDSNLFIKELNALECFRGCAEAVLKEGVE